MAYKGCKVKHKVFGEGTVYKENAEYVFVHFKNGKKTQFGNDENITKFLKFDRPVIVEKPKVRSVQKVQKAIRVEPIYSEDTKQGIDFLQYWIDVYLKETLQWERRTKVIQKDFVEDYPIERIKDMTLEEYMIAPSGYGQDKSFCRRIRYDLQMLCSMGNAFPSTFGIYLKGGKQITLAPTFENMFGDDYEKAFEYIKKCIYDLLIQGYNGDIQGIANNNTLNNMFKYKLLAVYFPDKYFPVCARDIAYALR